MIEGNSPAAARERLTGPEWLLLLVLAAMQFTHLVDFMIMLPLGPHYAGVLQISPQAFGIVVSAYSFSAAISGLLSALFVDRFDRKKALLVLYAGFTFSTLLCGLATDYWMLLVARALAGGFGGIVAATVLAIVGDVIPYSRRGFAMGIVMLAFSLGLIFGVPTGLYLASKLGVWAPFTVLAVLSAGMWVFACLVLPPVRGHLIQVSTSRRTPGDILLGLWRVIVNPNHVRAYALMAALVLGVFMIVPYIALYMVANVGRTRDELMYIYLCGGLATLVTVPLFGRLADHFGKLRVFRIMASFTIVPILLLTNLPPVPLMISIAVSTLFMVTTSARMVPAQALITACAVPEERGSFMSVLSSVQQFTSGLAAVVGGWMIGKAASGGEGVELPVSGAIPPISGYPLVGLVSVVFTVISVILVGYLRPMVKPADKPAAKPETTPDVVPERIAASA